MNEEEMIKMKRINKLISGKRCSKQAGEVITFKGDRLSNTNNKINQLVERIKLNKNE